jgi:nicotinamidase-related amidase
MEDRMRDWMKLIPESERQLYAKAGFMGDTTPGRRSALIVVDVTMGFCGSEGLSLDEAVAEYSTACGPASWVAMPRIARLIETFRKADLPIVYSLSDLATGAFVGKATKGKRSGPPPQGFNNFPASIAPRPQDWVVAKIRASAFFQTPLTGYLIQNGVDTLVVCGVSTSGCVRASVVDGFSHGFKTFVVDECCFDRSEFAHAANLFDMHAKYASVISLDEAQAMIAGPAAAAAAE